MYLMLSCIPSQGHESSEVFIGQGKCLNADVNKALNILKKSNVVSLKALYSKGEVDTPVRIRIA